MSANATAANFVFKDQNWDAYTQSRPPYPRSVFDHIYAYHEKHGGQFNWALDVGAGNGVVTKNFIEKFDHVTFTDVGEQYVEQARQRFAQVPADKISFLRAGFSDVEPEMFPSGGIDLAAGATCLHFLGKDRETFLARMARVIKPGGTFVAMQYGAYARFPESEPGQKEFDAVMDTLVDYVWANVAPNDGDAPMGLLSAHFDHLDFDPDLWTNVTRMHALYDAPAMSPRCATPEYKVRKDIESVVTFEDDGIISVNADAQWIHAYWKNLYPVADIEEVAKDQLDALKDAVGDRTVKLKWPFDLVLATRK